MRRDESTVYKKRLLVVPGPAPLLPRRGCSWKACGVMCTAGACKLKWNSAKHTRAPPLSPLSALMRDQTAECWHVKNSEAWWRDQVEFFTVLDWRERSKLDGWEQRCLISYSRLSLRRRSGQVGCKEPSGSLLWWKAFACHTNLIGWFLIADLWLDGALVNCNQSWSVSLICVNISE